MATPDIATLLANTIKNNQNNPLYGNSPIPSNQIQPTSSVNLGIPKQDTTNYAGITGGVSDSLANEFMSVNEERNRQQEITNQQGQDQLDIMKILSGKTADTQIANESAGVNAESANLTKYAEQLAGLNAQAMTLNREAQAVPLQVQENNRNTGATDRGVAPQEAGALRLNALKALSIAQQSDIAAAAATGSQLRLQAAKDKAQQIVDLKYKPLEDALAIKKQQYELNKDLLSSIDKKRTEALTLAINKEERQIAEAKATEKTIQSLAVDAGKNGAPANVLSKIASAKTFEEAIRVGGAYMADPLDRSIKAAQLRKLNTEINKINSEQKEAVVQSVVNEKDPTKLISNFFKTNPKIKTNQDINNAAGVVSAINNFSGAVGSGKIKGYGFLGGGFLPEAFKSQKGIQNKAQISSIEGKVQQWLSGAALSKAQEKLVNKMIPERNDTDATVRTKLNSLTNYMLGDIKGRATAQGAQFEYIPVDLFSQSDSSVQPDIKTSAVQAISAGYEPTEVIEFVAQNYPEQATKIQQARAAGYSDQEIIEYLSL